MKTLVSILLGSFFFALVLPAEEKKDPWVNLPAQYASSLPDCDKIEVFLLDGGVQDTGGEGTFPIRPYSQFSSIKKQRELKGEDAKRLCTTWRDLTFDMWSQAVCHFPIYGIRFYRDNEIQFETSICFACSNFYFPRNGNKFSWHGFRKDDDAGRALIKLLSDTIPRPERESELKQSGTDNSDKSND